MARLVVVLEVDVDPTLIDPHEVIEAVVDDQYEVDTYDTVPVTMVEAEWEG